jgi:transposase InsO family protein
MCKFNGVRSFDSTERSHHAKPWSVPYCPYAVAESFFSNLKNELVHHFRFNTRDEARSAIFDYIELFYNRKRIHQSLGYRTPVQVEREWQGA